MFNLPQQKCVQFLTTVSQPLFLLNGKFRLAASCRDTDFMEHTAKLARELIAEDPELAGWPALREKVDRIRYEGSRMEN